MSLFNSKLENPLGSTSLSTSTPDISHVTTSIPTSRHENRQIYLKNDPKTSNHQEYIERIQELESYSARLKSENGQLKQRLLKNDSKISSILHENSYLRWENEQFIIEMESLREKLDEEMLKTKELKAEIRCLQLNQKQINQIHKSRLQEERLLAQESTQEEIQFYKNLCEAQKSEFEVKLEQLRMKNDMLTQEMPRSDEELLELQSRFGKLQEEYQLEKEQRKNATFLLTEMSKDMKILIDELKRLKNL